MLIASLIDLKPINYTSAFPQTSFPENGPNDSFLLENNYAKVINFIEHDIKTQKMVSCDPYVENNIVYIVKVVDLNEEDLNIQKQQKEIEIRNQRNLKLQKCDWTQLQDAPLSMFKKQEWAVYRQTLRDITTQEDFPFNVIWPEIPSQ